MTKRCLMAALAACALLAGACGGDDESGTDRTTETGAATQTRTTAEGGTLKDVEPRANRANVVGGDLLIEEFVRRSGDDIVNYFEEVFTASGLPYDSPELLVLDEPTQVCTRTYRFDPRLQPSYLCFKPTATEIALSAQRMQALRESAGDGAAAFATAFNVATDANARLGPNPFFSNEKIPAEFDQQSACFVGAWIRNLGDRTLLDAGDEVEVLRAAAVVVPGNQPRVKMQSVALGYDEGIEVCRTKIKAGQAPAPAAGGVPLPEDVEPRAAAPNVSGGDAAIDELVKTFSTDAFAYFDKVFKRNDKTFRRPEVVVVDATADTGGCGPFDAQKQPFFLCFSSGGDKMTFSAPRLEGARESAGDTGPVFLIGYGSALSAYDQLNGDRLAKGAAVDAEFTQAAVCLVGAWNRNLATKKLLQPGDTEELLKIAEGFVPGTTDEGVSLGQDLFAAGFTQGSGGCKEEDS